MNSRAKAVGKTVLNGIDAAETGAHRAIHKGAKRAISATRRGTNWAAAREATASRKIGDLAETISDAGRGLPWKTLVAVSAASMVLGALLYRRD
jgi:hypothetical protein